MSTTKKAGIASMLVGSAALAIITGKRGAAAGNPIVPRAPTPSVLPRNPPGTPTVPRVPTEQPRPRAPAREYEFTALHRYDITADVLPVDGVGLTTVAKRALAHLHFDDASLKGYKTIERPGVGKVTRVRFHANALINNPVAFDREIGLAGVGSIWLVSAKEVGP